MTHIGLFYGSSTGATARKAQQIQACAQSLFGRQVEILDVAEYYLDEMLEFQQLILGIPTWNHGQLQADWEVVFDELDELDLSGRQVALFGLGDQVGYPETFGDALFFLADKVQTRGAQLVGRWPTDGYTFRQSWAVENGEFLGLMLDEDNQPLESQARIERWLAALSREFVAD